MSRITTAAKSLAEKLPYPVGKLMARVPFQYRPGLGKRYAELVQTRRDYEKLDPGRRKREIFERVRLLVQFAAANVKMYRELYAEQGFRPEDLQSFDDIDSIPIVHKATLLRYDLEDRSAPRPGRYVVNTGGSSGRTLSLYVEPAQMVVEWAHIHRAWEKVGFSNRALRLVFGGKFSGPGLAVYDAARHQYYLNTFLDYGKHYEELLDLFRRRPIRYLHGYPSAIFNFVSFMEEHPDGRLKARVVKGLKGILYGSEFPSPIWREYVDRALGVPSVSWYGHTERCVLAFEREEAYRFSPFQTYGFAEAKQFDDGYHLIGTSYHNYASPMIRYDTEDLISPETSDGVMEAFSIERGRRGEFIRDRAGNQISLTGLIYGRHHALFDKSKNVQISQSTPGTAVVYFVPLPGEIIDDPASLFDATSIDIELRFESLAAPIRTPGGKVRLLVSEQVAG